MNCLSDAVVVGPTTNSVPRFVEKMERMQTVVQGEDLVLECVVQGSPVPVVMWDKHSGQMPQGRVSLLLGNSPPEYHFTPQPLRAVGYCFHPWCPGGRAVGKSLSRLYLRNRKV